MKKGQVYEGIVEKVNFPNKGVINVEDKKVIVKNAIEGQKVLFSVNKIRKGRGEGRILEILEKSPIELDQPVCVHFGSCGGCTYQNLSYDEQLSLKKRQVKELLDSVIQTDYVFEGIKGSPRQFGYRNKMEFSFGDEVKDGPLSLGMHKRGSFHDIVTVNECQIVDKDYNLILSCVLNYFQEREISFYHKMQRKGYLRHLLVRKGQKTSELLIDLVTTSQEEQDLTPLVEALKNLTLDGKIVGILHTINDSLADVVQSDETRILYGQDYFYEKLLGLQFKISPFSFFQTNSLGAEVLYETAREYIGTIKDKKIFDLYSGTGTIAQILAPVAKKVIGVEIVEEAVEAARVNAKLNDLHNCEFIAGDVLKVIDSIEDKPDLIVLDPPRDGIHPKALEKIIAYGVDRLVYISCKPTSLVRDLEILQERGYQVERAVAVDMFAGTVHVETVILMIRCGFGAKNGQKLG
ncbi:23S rRNA m(5)U-1939 methyltransferase [Lachnotalea glycerini]|uniref:23S rRNA m(5)U-1939 methyltransferase n=1 Tax=Lachnotalea glycerini TaxID=1763509 RepID=A0A318EJL7_9FIRM|nr:23S rRNA (uracil(1939)-C(5))-methyltransferase RlmD [Lachnotalea glycerini]PXV87864.1 23S rRNA m(5)U-1939 methyltransferase [Lachnotalea glycerini]